MSVVTVYAKSYEEVSGIYVSQNEHSVTINARKPRSSKRLEIVVQRNQLLSSSKHEEDKNGNNITVIYTPAQAVVVAEYEGELSYAKNGDLVVKTEDGDVTIPSSVLVEISTEVDEAPKASSKSKAGKAKAKAKVEEDDEEEEKPSKAKGKKKAKKADW